MAVPGALVSTDARGTGAARGVLLSDGFSLNAKVAFEGKNCTDGDYGRDEKRVGNIIPLRGSLNFVEEVGIPQNDQLQSGYLLPSMEKC